MFFIIKGGNKLISNAQRDEINKNRPNIVQCLHIEETLISKLLACEIITTETASEIRSMSNEKKNAAMLDCALRLSQGKMEIFMRLLEENNQEHVAALFEYNQGFIYIHNMKRHSLLI